MLGRSPVAAGGYLLAVLALLGAASAALAVDVAAFLDRTRVAVGESAVLSIQVSGSQQAPAPQLPSIDGVRVQYIGPSTEMRIENGRTSSSITHRYHLFPQRAGHFTLGPFSLQADGRVYETEALTLQVAARGAAAGPGTGLSLEVQVDRREPFVGERVPMTIRLLIPDGMRVDDLQFPSVQAEGLNIGALPQPAQRDEILGGRRYRVLYFETHFTPSRPADVELRAAMALSVLEQGRGQRGLFGGMMGGMFAERRPVEVQAAPLQLRARPLPLEGRPPGFTGAVGTFDLQVSAAPTTVDAGDPITVRIELSGDGELSRAQPPKLPELPGMRVYDPVAIKDLGADRRGHEQVVIPQSPEASQLPALAFSFFDPHREEYRTIHRGPISLAVAAASDTPSAVIADVESARRLPEPAPIGRDIVYIKGSPGTWRARGGGVLGDGWFWAINALPAIGWGLLSWRARRREILAANPRLVRRRAAPGELQRGLSELERQGAAGQFADNLWRLWADYLAAMLDLPPGAVDALRVGRALAAAGYDDATRRAGERLCGELLGRRYAPAGQADGIDRHELVERVRRTAAAIERRQDRIERARTQSAGSLFAAAFLGCAAAVVWSAPALATAGDAQRDAAFFAGNQAYAEERYEEALEHYAAVLATGYESGAVHFNRGNTHFKRGEVAKALASYLRAARLLPRDPDVAANLEFAAESLELPAAEEALWRRVAFVFAERFNERELALGFVVLWWSVWIVAGVGVAVPRLRESLRLPVRLVAAAAVFALLNLGYRAYQMELWNSAVVTASDAVVRFEPDDNGTEHFAPPLGARLRIDEDRGAWLLVARDDGRRGWLRESVLERLR